MPPLTSHPSGGDLLPLGRKVDLFALLAAWSDAGEGSGEGIETPRAVVAGGWGLGAGGRDVSPEVNLLAREADDRFVAELGAQANVYSFFKALAEW